MASVRRSRKCTPWSNSTSTSTSEDLLDLPDLSGEGDDVRGATVTVFDELDRGRPVQAVGDDPEVPVPLHLHEAARVRQRRSSRRAATEGALREAEEVATAAKVGTAAKLHVDEEPGTRGHLLGGG